MLVKSTTVPTKWEQGRIVGRIAGLSTSVGKRGTFPHFLPQFGPPGGWLTLRVGGSPPKAALATPLNETYVICFIIYFHSHVLIHTVQLFHIATKLYIGLFYGRVAPLLKVQNPGFSQKILCFLIISTMSISLSLSVPWQLIAHFVRHEPYFIKVNIIWSFTVRLIFYFIKEFVKYICFIFFFFIYKTEDKIKYQSKEELKIHLDLRWS